MPKKIRSLRWYDDGVSDGLQMAIQMLTHATDPKVVRQKLLDIVCLMRIETQKAHQ